MSTWTQEQERRTVLSWEKCGHTESATEYPHQIVLFERGSMGGCIKQEPMAPAEFDNEGSSAFVEPEGTIQYSIRDGVNHVPVGNDSHGLAIHEVGHIENQATLHHRQFPPQERNVIDRAVKEESLSDDEVVDVYPMGMELVQYGGKMHAMGQTESYEAVTELDQNGFGSKRHDEFVYSGQGGSSKNFERLPIFKYVATQGGQEVVEDSAALSQSEGDYMFQYKNPVTSNFGCDKGDRNSARSNYGLQVHNENDIDGLGNAEAACFVHVDEGSRAGDGTNRLHEISVEEGDYLIKENLKEVLANGIDTSKVPHRKNGAWVLSHIGASTAEAQHGVLFYEENPGDHEDGGSDRSSYQPSSNESDSDSNSIVDTGTKPTRSMAQNKVPRRVDGKLSRVSDGWKVNENKCPTCCSFFSTKKALTSHVCTASNIECSICGKRFRDLDALQRHEKIHLEVKPYSCDVCGKGFREKGNLTTHKRTHTKETPYKCEHCNKKFADPSNFNRHRKGHLGLAIAKPCLCKFCGERFSRTANLLRHLVRFHKGEKEALNDDLEIGTEAEIPSKFKTLACSFCGKTFGKKETLQTHELLHEECQALTCKVCRRLLSSRDGLIQHLKVHGVQVDGKARKEYICNFCGASFLRKPSLIGHERTHTDEWLPTCTICGAHFTLKTSLNRHMLTHSGKKPHKCDICEKRFLRPYDLTVHKRTHSKERPYSCNTCGRSFAAQTNFVKHKRKCKPKTKAL